ncbi:MAG: hypothetical protein CENE_01358 [Candidatus Celerinatantimonas neptuna]|nr:MAG: hypothetical protein CENE_01358 [Candidatus Celerinatantimonas neptuna]
MSSLSPTLRIARDVDDDAIRRIYIQIFDRPAEARFVEAIRQLDQCPQLSMVAEVDNEISAHLLLSEISLSGCPELKLMALEPMVVIPKCQGSGVGRAMVNVAIEQIRRRGYHAIIAIGPSDYYFRFGFKALEPLGWNWPFAIGAESIAVAPLTSELLDIYQGDLDFTPPFYKLFPSRK